MELKPCKLSCVGWKKNGIYSSFSSVAELPSSFSSSSSLELDDSSSGMTTLFKYVICGTDVSAATTHAFVLQVSQQPAMARFPNLTLAVQLSVS
jgi:hypothetical protein